jgi:putative addiction module component (TIGR02574 family)
MPEISRFLGIVIKMFFDDHNPLRVHYGTVQSRTNNGSAAYRSREAKTRVILSRNEEGDMAHSLPEIEKDALRLSVEDRARLAIRLLSSLEETTESPEEIEKLWIAEAERRFQELRKGVVQGIPAREVFAELRTKRS